MKTVRERIELAIVEELNVTNLIAQNEPEVFIPRFIQTLTDRLNEIFADELKYRRK
jgi:hypothetical protein